MTLDEIKAAAADVARTMQQAGDSIGPELRKRFIDVRAELFRRGIVDPLLIRFDSATVPRATVQQIADHLGVLAENLPV